ncbi:astacin-like [Drosophila rhopaloa]|uniref:Metalloendopeptidase n=1 Tax=Drosophila rhopaloa TaxID=1041015 RepID=A0A6P4F7R3_DRORH|nr:astacin-like [Drosophila rhopaloa]
MEKSQNNTRFFWLLVLLFISVGVSRPMEDLDSPELIVLTELADAVFGYPDYKITGALVEAYNETWPQNPEELGTYFEGDILVPLSYKSARFNGTRNGMRITSYRWKGGVVPYKINGNFTPEQLKIINHAFEQYHTRTCVRFRPRTTENDYISIINSGSGCWSCLGRIGGCQKVNLQSECLLNNGTTIHELMHVLGFDHEHNRHDRDSYILVVNDNIEPKKEHNFAKADSKKHSSFGVEYDYSSVMHYSLYAFSRNNEPTMVPLRDTSKVDKIGSRDDLSKGDVIKINKMYECNMINNKK